MATSTVVLGICHVDISCLDESDFSGVVEGYEAFRFRYEHRHVHIWSSYFQSSLHLIGCYKLLTSIGLVCYSKFSFGPSRWSFLAVFVECSVSRL